MNANEFDEVCLEGFKACYNAICSHLPLESLQDLGWQEFVNIEVMMNARKVYMVTKNENLLRWKSAKNEKPEC